MDEIQLDEWKLVLIKKRAELEACQIKNNYKSCLACHLLLKCELRDNYIQSVYDSMSKGSTGGFEF